MPSYVASSAGERAGPSVPVSFSMLWNGRRLIHPVHDLVRHSDRGSQYVPAKHTERLGEADIEPPVGTTTDSHDTALTATINGLYKIKVIRRHGPWRSFDAVALGTREWVGWFNNHRHLGSIGNVPSAEAKGTICDIMLDEPGLAGYLKSNGLRQTRGNLLFPFH